MQWTCRVYTVMSWHGHIFLLNGQWPFVWGIHVCSICTTWLVSLSLTKISFWANSPMASDSTPLHWCDITAGELVTSLQVSWSEYPCIKMYVNYVPVLDPKLWLICLYMVWKRVPEQHFASLLISLLEYCITNRKKSNRNGILFLAGRVHT